MTKKGGHPRSLGYSQSTHRGSPRSRAYSQVPGVLPDLEGTSRSQGYSQIPEVLRDPGDTPYNEWAIPGGSAQKGYTFFWLQVCERVDISLVEAGGLLKE